MRRVTVVVRWLTWKFKRIPGPYRAAIIALIVLHLGVLAATPPSPPRKIERLSSRCDFELRSTEELLAHLEKVDWRKSGEEAREQAREVIDDRVWLRQVLNGLYRIYRIEGISEFNPDFPAFDDFVSEVGRLEGGIDRLSVAIMIEDKQRIDDAHAQLLPQIARCRTRLRAVRQ